MLQKIIIIGERATSIIQILSNSGYEVVTCSTFQEGLEKSQTEGIKIIVARETANISALSDSIKSFKSDLVNKWTQLIVVTNEKDSIKRSQLFDLGFDEVISMPVTNREFITRIGNLSKKAQDIEEVAFKDKLTMVYNRRYFDNQIEIELARSLRKNVPISVMFIDLDKFKHINDTYGHAAGDEVLIKVGELLRTNTRMTDVVARFGGEEFVVLFSNTDGEKAAAKAQQLLEICRSKPIKLTDNTEINVTFSSGVAEWREGLSVTQWLKLADEGVYEAKNQGRNRIVLHDAKSITDLKEERQYEVVVAGALDIDTNALLQGSGHKFNVTSYSKISDINNDYDLLILGFKKEVDYKAIEDVIDKNHRESLTCVVQSAPTKYDIAKGLVKGIDFYFSKLGSREIAEIMQRM